MDQARVVPGKILDCHSGICVRLPAGTPSLGLDGALYLLPYFLAGLAVRRFAMVPMARRCSAALAVVAALALVMIGEPVPDPERRTVWMLIAGVATCLLLMAWQPRWAPLARLGQASYAIYLYHVFFSAGTRVVLNGVGIQSILVHCAVGMLAGLFGPGLIRRYVRANPWSRPFLVGESACRPSVTGISRGAQA